MILISVMFCLLIYNHRTLIQASVLDASSNEKEEKHLETTEKVYFNFSPLYQMMHFFSHINFGFMFSTMQGSL